MSLPVPLRTFEVWYVPGDRTPLRIGEKLADYHKALTLAEAAAAELPTYAFLGGQVLIVWRASVLKVLPTAPTTGGQRPVMVMHGMARREFGRVILQDLRERTSEADPDQAAPRAWIDRLHAALCVMASPEDQARYRLDGLYCITMDFLHRQVAAVLRQVDRLVVVMPVVCDPEPVQPLVV